MMSNALRKYRRRMSGGKGGRTRRPRLRPKSSEKPLVIRPHQQVQRSLFQQIRDLMKQEKEDSEDRTRES